MNDAVTVLHWRKKKGIEIKEELPLYSDYAKQHKEDSLDKDSLEAAYDQANRGSTTGGARGEDPDGKGSPNPGGHQRGKAKRGQRWLQPNPKNLY